MLRIVPGLFALTIVCACSDSSEEVATMSFDASASSTALARQTPSEFKVLVVKAEMLRGEDDADPAVIFDAAGGTDQAAILDLTADARPLWNGDISESYFGTYTHARITIAAAGQVIVHSDTDGTDSTKGYLEMISGVDNSDGQYEEAPSAALAAGDVLVWEDDMFQFFEVDEAKTYTYSADPTTLQAYTDTTPPQPVQLVELSEEIIIEAGGSYVLRANFETTDTFEWNDLDDDGLFEPAGDDHDGTMNGFDFRVLEPTLDAWTE